MQINWGDVAAVYAAAVSTGALGWQSVWHDPPHNPSA